MGRISKTKSLCVPGITDPPGLLFNPPGNMGKFSICDFLSPGLGKTHIGPTERRLLPVLHFSERRLASTVCCLITLKKVASMVEGSQCCQLVGKKAVLVTGSSMQTMDSPWSLPNLGTQQYQLCGGLLGTQSWGQ